MLPERLYDEELRARSIYWMPVTWDGCWGAHDPACPFCHEEIAGFHRNGKIVECPSCGKESYLWLVNDNCPQIVGLKSLHDVAYENWMKEGRPAL